MTTTVLTWLVILITIKYENRKNSDGKKNRSTPKYWLQLKKSKKIPRPS